MSIDRIDAFDVDALRPGPEIQQLTRTGTTRARSRKWNRRFIMFPWAWMDALKAVDRSQTYRLALLLVYEHWRAGGLSCCQMLPWSGRAYLAGRSGVR
jgi:hypothetical protein